MGSLTSVKIAAFIQNKLDTSTDHGGEAEVNADILVDGITGKNHDQIVREPKPDKRHRVPINLCA